MLQSMTGFGRAEVKLPDKKVIIEIKSLNGKNIDTSIKTPLIYRDKDIEIRQLLNNRLIRGKIDCSIFYELNEDTASANINKNVFRKYYNDIQELKNELSIDNGDIVSAVLRLPDVIRMDKAQPDENEWSKIRHGLNMALDQLISFREQEGTAMKQDLEKRISSITTLLKEVDPYEKSRITKLRERMKKNLHEFMGKEEFDENRFEQELIFYIEKLDISEEKVRLANHCEYFTEILNLNEPAGKKLGFISQEVGREINTLGSKANNYEIQRIVIQMKDELERIKEQLANIL